MKNKTLTEIKQLEIIRLCHSGLDSRSLRTGLLQHLRMVIPFDYAYFSTTDPATQLSTSSVLATEPPSWCMDVFLANEFLQEDFNKFNGMLRSHQTVGILSEATKNDLSLSQRYRDMLVPMAMTDELHAIFITDTACWGTVCLHRGQLPYTLAESAYLAQLVPHIAEGLRKALLVSITSSVRLPDSPGVLILSEDMSIVAMTAAAEYWLTELAETRDKHGLPGPVRSVVASLRAIRRGLATNRIPKIRMRTRSGHWLVLYASWLSSSTIPAQISVVFEVAQPAEVAPLIMQAYQLTKREGEITQCVLRGWSTTEIAGRLHISSNTVQDHLKAIFDKVDVSSRGELAARIFTQQYLPQFSADVSSDPFEQFGVDR
jgi:DNA-binding CsgD family transcriptional regulator